MGAVACGSIYLPLLEKGRTVVQSTYCSSTFSSFNHIKLLPDLIIFIGSNNSFLFLDCYSSMLH